MNGAMKALNRIPMDGNATAKQPADWSRSQASSSARESTGLRRPRAKPGCHARHTRDLTNVVAKAAAILKRSETALDLVEPKAAAKPERPDDLKAISGIGPKLEKVLNDLGIWTYAQIANWSDAQIGWVDDALAFNGRIVRDKWIEQASALAKRN